MGVPALFRWLSNKYPKIVSPVIEEKPRVVDDTTIPIDITGKNPNGEEFDNLYLDFNGIVHPCTHPEDKAAPSTEAEMMIEIFKYTDRVVNMVRPRKLIMIAVDGVAPRAKMNQQRARRFRSAQEAQEKVEKKEEFLKMLRQQNGGVLPDHALEEASKRAWDSNAITPGTPFMDILAASLRYWVAYKINNDAGWANIKVVISDATVPGEGEHKIMEFIRSQRSSPEHDPNTRHVFYGLDADLIMLGLATHEPHFRVLREDVFFNEVKPGHCRLCHQPGHMAAQCQGDTKKKSGEFDEKAKVPTQKPFIWLHVSVLREYLDIEMRVPQAPFKQDLERAIDDWVFMCFFVGNDFLPHLPSLSIREGGIDTLIAIWRDNLPIMGGYVTKDGTVDFNNAQHILRGLAKQEDAIFERRKEEDDRQEAREKRRKLGRNEYNPRGRKPEHAAMEGSGLNLISLDSLERNVTFQTSDKSAITHDMVMNRSAQANQANKSAAALLKEKLAARKSDGSALQNNNGADKADESQVVNGKDGAGHGNADGNASLNAPQKRKLDTVEGEDTIGHSGRKPKSESNGDEDAKVDDVRLWEEGYRDRYYEAKFGKGPEDQEFRHQLAREYAIGLQWVLLYYLQGCPSWTWYYSAHYAPFAADFVDIGTLKPTFDKGEPFKPFEQLMGVMPVASNHTLPKVFHSLMTDEDSDIVDFYPLDFALDMNGEKVAWKAVILLPFIDEKRLLAAMATRYPLLNDEERRRNGRGREALFFSDVHPMYDGIVTNFYSKKQGVPKYSLVPSVTNGLMGNVEKIEEYMPASTVKFPLPQGGWEDIEDDRSLTVYYEMPTSTNVHKSMLLRGLKMPTRTLNDHDRHATKNKSERSGRSFGGVPLRQSSRRGRGGGTDDGRFNYGVSRNGGESNGGSGGYDGRSNYGAPQYGAGSNGWSNNPPPFYNQASYGNGPPPPPVNSYQYGQHPPPYPPPGQYGNFPPIPPPNAQNQQPGQYGRYVPPHGRKDGNYQPPPEQGQGGYQRGGGGFQGRGGYQGQGGYGQGGGGGYGRY